MITGLQVWCDNKLVGILMLSGEFSPGRTLTLLNCDQTGSFKNKTFHFSQRNCIVDDMEVMMRHGPVHPEIPDYAEAFKMPHTMQTKFSWPVLGVSVEDYETWIFDRDDFEPI